MHMTEQRLGRLEKHNKRLTTALTLMAVAICAVVLAFEASLYAIDDLSSRSANLSPEE